MTQKKSDDAVSPVIGVMLMLVVTILIAAVVAAFGTGVVGNTESAPNVVLDVEIINYDKVLDGMGEYKALTGPDFRITHVSGDTLDTGDIELRFAWTDTSGTKHSSKYSAASIEGAQPMYLEMAGVGTFTVGGYELKGIAFGEAELEPGYTIKTTAKALGNVAEGKVQHVGSPYMDKIFNNGVVMISGDTEDDKGVMQYLDKGTKVDVTILHIPSNTIIYDKAVYVK